MKASMVSDEQNLIARAREGDVGAFQEIVDLYKRQIFFLALDLTGNHHDAEDLSQEVLVRAYTSIKGFRGEAKISSWLHRIAVNTHLDTRRKKALMLLKQSDELNESLVAHSITDSRSNTNPEEKMVQADLQKHIDEALQVLTPKERSVFVLRHYQDHPIKEIADMMEISEGTVKSFLFRAIRKLQKALAMYQYQFEARSSHE
jgi:RNA polymerase sigma-70 factor (ECF subfamily)